MNPETPNMTVSPAPVADAEQRMEGRIRARIVRAEQAIRWTELGFGLVGWGAWLLGALTLGMLVDHWLWELSSSARWVIWSGLVAGSVIWGLRFLVPPLGRTVNPVYAAKAIEQSAPPHFQNSLVNLLLLGQTSEHVRPVIMSGLRRQAAQRLETADADLWVDQTRLLRATYVVVGITAGLALYGLIAPKNPLPSLARVLAPWWDIARPARVRLADVQPGATTLYRGQLLQITCRAEGLADGESVQVHISAAADDRSLVTETLSADATGRIWTVAVATDRQQLPAHFTYRIEAGDARTSPYSVELLQAPYIDVAELHYDFPAYTGLPRQKADSRGDIVALEGTRVTLVARANQPIKTAYWELLANGPTRAAGGGPDATPSPQEGAARNAQALPLDVNGLDARGQLTLALQSDRQTPLFDAYQLRFTNANGASNQQPARYRIQVTPDLAPHVEILQPNRRALELPLDDVLKVEVRALDPDFALQTLTLHGAVRGVTRWDLELLGKLHSGQLVRTTDLAPREIGLEAGETLEYWVEAADNRTLANGQPAPNVTRSETYRLQILPPRSRDGGTGASGRNGAGRSREQGSPSSADAAPRDNTVDGTPDRSRAAGPRENAPQQSRSSSPRQPASNSEEDQADVSDRADQSESSNDRANGEEGADSESSATSDASNGPSSAADTAEENASAEPSSDASSEPGDRADSEPTNRGSDQASEASEGSSDAAQDNAAGNSNNASSEQSSDDGAADAGTQSAAEGGTSGNGSQRGSVGGSKRSSAGNSGKGANGNNSARDSQADDSADDSSESTSESAGNGGSRRGGNSSSNANSRSTGDGNESGGSARAEQQAPATSQRNARGSDSPDEAQADEDQADEAGGESTNDLGDDTARNGGQDRRASSSDRGNGRDSATNGGEGSTEGERTEPNSSQEQPDAQRRGSDEGPAEDGTTSDATETPSARSENASSGSGRNARRSQSGQTPAQDASGEQAADPSTAASADEGSAGAAERESGNGRQPDGTQSGGGRNGQTDRTRPPRSSANEDARNGAGVKNPATDTDPDDSSAETPSDGSPRSRDATNSPGTPAMRRARNEGQSSDPSAPERPQPLPTDGSDDGSAFSRVLEQIRQSTGRDVGQASDQSSADRSNAPSNPDRSPSDAAETATADETANSEQRSAEAGTDQKQPADRSGNSPERSTAGEQSASDGGPSDSADADESPLTPSERRASGEPTTSGDDRSASQRSEAASDSPSGEGHQNSDDQAAGQQASSDEGNSAGDEPNHSPDHVGDVSGGRRPGGASNPDGRTSQDRPEQPEGAPPASEGANLEYAQRATDLVLEYLKDQKNEQEVSERLGWTPDEVRAFVQRWQKMRDESRQAGPAAAEAVRRWQDQLRGLGLQPPEAKIRAERQREKTRATLRQGATADSIPAEYRDQYRAYLKNSP